MDVLELLAAVVGRHPGGRAAAGWSGAAARRHVPAGDVVLRAGEEITHIHVVSSGTVELRRPGDARRPVISTVHRGGLFGDIPHALGVRAHIDAVATTEVELLSVAVDVFDDAVCRSWELAAAWSLSLAARALESHARLSEVLAGHLDHRVAALLQRRCNDEGRVELTQEAMARLLGVQRSSISDVVRRLERRGLVRRGYGHVIVTDPDRLAAVTS